MGRKTKRVIFAIFIAYRPMRIITHFFSHIGRYSLKMSYENFFYKLELPLPFISPSKWERLSQLSISQGTESQQLLFSPPDCIWGTLLFQLKVTISFFSGMPLLDKTFLKRGIHFFAMQCSGREFLSKEGKIGLLRGYISG